MDVQVAPRSGVLPFVECVQELPVVHETGFVGPGIPVVLTQRHGVSLGDGSDAVELLLFCNSQKRRPARQLRTDQKKYFICNAGLLCESDSQTPFGLRFPWASTGRETRLHVCLF